MKDWQHRKWTNFLLLAVIGIVVACLVLLGNWQLRRLA
jgi:cytochrome oxidase assembly protein ShyY1